MNDIEDSGPLGESADSVGAQKTKPPVTRKHTKKVFKSN